MALGTEAEDEAYLRQEAELEQQVHLVEHDRVELREAPHEARRVLQMVNQSTFVKMFEQVFDTFRKLSFRLSLEK